jgi:hypothetical protein
MQDPRDDGDDEVELVDPTATDEPYDATHRRVDMGDMHPMALHAKKADGAGADGSSSSGSSSSSSSDDDDDDGELVVLGDLDAAGQAAPPGSPPGMAGTRAASSVSSQPSVASTAFVRGPRKRISWSHMLEDVHRRKQAPTALVVPSSAVARPVSNNGVMTIEHPRASGRMWQLFKLLIQGSAGAGGAAPEVMQQASGAAALFVQTATVVLPLGDEGDAAPTLDGGGAVKGPPPGYRPLIVPTEIAAAR